MNIIEKESGISVRKPDGSNITYYLFDEYEIHANELEPGSTQQWHHHEVIWETLYLTDGELTLEWKENEQKKEVIIHAGDVVEVGFAPHTFANNTEKPAKFLVIKQVLTGTNNRKIFKEDKIIDKP